MSITCCLVLAGCSQPAIYSSSKIESTSYSEKTVKVDQPLELEVLCDYANIETYQWDKQEVKFEMKKRVRGTEEKSKLEERLKDFTIDINENQGKVTFTSRYKGKIQSSEDKLLDIKMYIPRSVKSIKNKLEKGYIKYQDDLRCYLEVEAKTAYIDVNRLDGAFKLIVETGNIRINGGTVKGDSEIQVSLGNLRIKAAYEKGVQCKYETKTGNIELLLPSDMKLGLECSGTIEANDFTALNTGKDIMVKSGIGKIALRKF